MAPKFEPVIVTEVPVPPRLGDTPVTKGVVPTVIDTLSNVAVARVVFWVLLTIRPMYAFWPMLTVMLDPACIQLTPSVEPYALKVLPLRTSFIQYGRVGPYTSYSEESVPPAVGRL